MQKGDLSYNVIGAAIAVHTFLGNGFQELIYQRSLAIELRKRGIRFVQEYTMNILYQGHLVGKRRVDFFIEDTLMLEIKAVSALDDVHLAQAMNYCHAYNLPYGLLINFGSKSLQYKRVYNRSNKGKR